MESKTRFASVAMAFCLTVLIATVLRFHRTAPLRFAPSANAEDWGRWSWLREPPHDSQVRGTRPPPWATTRNTIAEIHEIFDEFDGFDPRRTHWVKIESGPVGWKFGGEGWLLEITANNLQLLSPYGTIDTFRRPVGTRLHFQSDEWVDVGLAWSQNNVAWRVTPGSFRKVCEQFLAEANHPKTSAESSADAFYAGINERSSRFSQIVEASRFAVWAAWLDDWELSDSLIQVAKRTLKECAPYGHDGTTDADLHRFVIGRLVENCRSASVTLAHSYSEPRTELLRFWRRASRLPSESLQIEAKRMIADYENLLAEDAALSEPTESEFNQLTPEGKVLYWLHHLRDADVKQFSDPGSCLVTWHPTLPCYSPGPNDPLPGLRDPDSKDRRNPAYELVQLGEVALPLVRQHLRDSRPTRCEEHWRSYWPDGHKLVTYGECCRQIAEAIERNVRQQAIAPANTPMK